MAWRFQIWTHLYLVDTETDFWIPVYVVKIWLVQVPNSCLKIIFCNIEQQFIVSQAWTHE